jgi:DNA-binding CsgD family transcriptional regulator
LLVEHGASPEHVAAQLLRCPPTGDPWAVEQLLAAARLVGARSAFEAEATYLSRALDEGPAAEERPGIVFALALAEVGFDTDAAIVRLRELHATGGPPDVIARTRTLLGGLYAHRGSSVESIEMLTEALQHTTDPDERLRIEAALIECSRIDDVATVRTRPRRAELWQQVDAGEVTEPNCVASIALGAAMANRPADETTARALAASQVFGSDMQTMDALGWAQYNLIRTLWVTGAYADAMRLVEFWITDTQNRGNLIDRGCALYHRAELLWRMGEIERAEPDARAMLAIAGEYRWRLGEMWGRAILGPVLLEQGNFDEALEVLSGGELATPTALLPNRITIGDALTARSRVHVVLGRIPEAVADARKAGICADTIGFANPNFLHWRAALAEALLAAGEDEEAQQVSAADVAAAKASGAPRGVGIALFAAAQARPAEAVPLLQEAVGVLGGSGAHMEVARAHHRLGAALHAAGEIDAARTELRTAIGLAQKRHAGWLEQEALADLRATGAKPRTRSSTGRDALTPSERRIADLAAAGRQNREIADELFVTVSTVEFHLRNAYRKLGITGRSDLTAAMSAA